MASAIRRFICPVDAAVRFRASARGAGFWLLVAVPLWIPLPMAGMRGCTLFSGGLILYHLDSCPYPIEPGGFGLQLPGIGLNLTPYAAIRFDLLSLVPIAVLAWAGVKAIRIYRRSMSSNFRQQLTGDARE